LTINTEMLPEELMIDVELSPELRDEGVQNHLKIEENTKKRRRFEFAVDSYGKPAIAQI
jgi:hypothetical protein